VDQIWFLDYVESDLDASYAQTHVSFFVWADAYMLAFTAVAGLKLITFDRALKSRGNDVLVL